ncbi:ParD-like family protein, partial [Shewanella chilikensis]|nr:ParD-like family protein [Shewanella chilikensis]
SINAQAEFWIKMGMLAELNPDRSFNELMAELYQREAIKVPGAQNA